MNENNRAVILMNLGSPGSTDVKDLKNYLTEFLMDERVIDKPYIIRTLFVSEPEVTGAFFHQTESMILVILGILVTAVYSLPPATIFSEY